MISVNVKIQEQDVPEGFAGEFIVEVTGLQTASEGELKKAAELHASVWNAGYGWILEDESQLTEDYLEEYRSAIAAGEDAFGENVNALTDPLLA